MAAAAGGAAAGAAGGEADLPAPSAGLPPAPSSLMPAPASFSSVPDIPMTQGDGLPNPGKFDDLTKESKQIVVHPEAFDGLRMEMHKGVTQVMSSGHAISLASSRDPDEYYYTATYVDQAMTLLGRLYTDYTVQAMLFQNVTKNLKLNLSGQVAVAGSSDPLLAAGRSSTASAEVEYAGSSWTASGRWASQTGETTLSLNQAMSKRLAVGASFMLNRAQLRAIQTVGLRYTAPLWTGTLHVSHAYLDGQTASASYTHVVTDKLYLATEMSIARDGAKALGWATRWSAGLQYIFETALCKAAITQDGRVSGYLEQSLSPTTKLLMAAEVDHTEAGKHKFGVGVSVQI